MTAALLEKVSFDFPLEVLKQTEEGGQFHIVGYAATTDFDLQGDVITEEALQEAAGDLLKNSTVLLNHDLERPIGKVTKVLADKNGLLVDALISSTESEIIQKIKEGILNKFSIRGQVLEREKKYMPDLDRVVNVIKRLTLLEVSLVSVPANPEAKAIGWYVSKALEALESRPANPKGGKPMSEEQVVIEEITPKEPGPENPEPDTPQPEAAKAPEPPPEQETIKAKEPAPATPPAPAAAVAAPAPVEKAISSAGPQPIFSLVEKLIGLGGEAGAVGQQIKTVLKQMVGDAGRHAPKGIGKADLERMISGEVKKQLDSALAAVPTQRKGLVTQAPEAEEVQKKFESLPPEKKLRVALALAQE